MAPRVYLDACAVQRVLDPCPTAQEQREARALERIFRAVEERALELVWSEFLTAECILHMPPAKAERSEWAGYLRDLATQHIARNAAISGRASELQRLAGISAVDALHLSSAESAGAPFVTVDRKDFLDRVLRARASTTLVMDPLEAVEHLGLSID